MTTDTTRIWGQVVAWLAENAPVNHQGLGAPATAEELAAAEQRLDVRFTDELRAYLSLNNGTRTSLDGHGRPVSTRAGEFLSGGWWLLPLEAMLRVHEFRTSVAVDNGQVWPKQWVPIVAESSDCGEMYGYFIDVETGAVGSWSDGDQDDPHVYPGLAAYLADIYRQFAELRDNPTPEGCFTITGGAIEWS
ncbi:MULTISPECIES: SMI1/KNR4 family protein [unclassified Streptomyces]|uniref:SMI1/KNR4 family protein n=1 Tax=unclassified Streptomyces TaxID=2593676 RepID=UPI0033C73005